MAQARGGSLPARRALPNLGTRGQHDLPVGRRKHPGGDKVRLETRDLGAYSLVVGVASEEAADTGGGGEVFTHSRQQG